MTTTTKKAGKAFTGKKAQFLNMVEDGIKIRSTTFRNKKAYNRKDQSWKKD
jgi:hypothetical protein